MATRSELTALVVENDLGGRDLLALASILHGCDPIDRLADRADAMRAFARDHGLLDERGNRTRDGDELYQALRAGVYRFDRKRQQARLGRYARKSRR